MNVNNAFPSKFLRADDFDEDQILTIASVKIETVGQGEQASEKPVVYFREMEQGLALNKTNANNITGVLGSPETDDWIGKKIIIGQSEVEFQGKTTAAVRVRIKRPQQEPEKPKTPSQTFIDAAKPYAAQASWDLQSKAGVQHAVRSVLSLEGDAEVTKDEFIRAADVLNRDGYDPFVGE